jgi:hypothetical protein
MSIMPKRPSKLKMKGTQDYRTLSPVLLPKNLDRDHGIPKSEAPQEIVAQKYMLETTSDIQSEGAGGTSKMLTEDDRGQARQADIRLHLIKGVERMQGDLASSPPQSRPRPVHKILVTQDSGIYNHLEPIPDTKSEASSQGYLGITMRPGIGGLSISGATANRGQQVTSPTGDGSGGGNMVDDGVKQVAMVPLRNKQQAQVTYTTIGMLAMGIIEGTWPF